MKQKYSERFYKLISLMFMILLAISACAPPNASETPASTAPTNEPTVVPAESLPATETPIPTQVVTGGNLVISNDDPCSLLTSQQVEAGFGQSVTETKTNEESMARECKFKFENDDTAFRITYYAGEGAKNYFAALITAGRQSCDEFLEAIFDIAFAPLTEKYPVADQSLLALPLENLYREYIGMLGECMYIHNEARADVGDNVTATETIFLNWSSNIAILSEDRVVELNYTEPVSEDAQQALSAATDKESYYALADPYRQQVLSGYTEIIIELLKQATGQ